MFLSSARPQLREVKSPSACRRGVRPLCERTPPEHSGFRRRGHRLSSSCVSSWQRRSHGLPRCGRTRVARQPSHRAQRCALSVSLSLSLCLFLSLSLSPSLPHSLALSQAHPGPLRVAGCAPSQHRGLSNRDLVAAALSWGLSRDRSVVTSASCVGLGTSRVGDTGAFRWEEQRDCSQRGFVVPLFLQLLPGRTGGGSTGLWLPSAARTCDPGPCRPACLPPPLTKGQGDVENPPPRLLASGGLPSYRLAHCLRGGSGVETGAEVPICPHGQGRLLREAIGDLGGHTGGGNASRSRAEA